MNLLKVGIPGLFLFLVTIAALMSNKDVSMELRFFFDPDKVYTVAFWEVVIFCVALGFIIAAVFVFIDQLDTNKKMKDLAKADQEKTAEIERLDEDLRAAQEENEALKRRFGVTDTEMEPLPEPPPGPDEPLTRMA